MKAMASMLVACLSILAALAAQAQAGAVSLKVGVLNDRSGILSDFSGEGSVVAARMAVEDFKAAQKDINVEIVFADHQNKPDVGSAIARRWYDQEGVDAIFDVPHSGLALSVSEIAREKNKILIVSSSASSDLTGPKCTPNLIHWTFDTWSLAHGTGTALVKQGGDTWFFITADYAFGHALERDTAAVVTAAGGKVLGVVRHPQAAPDFSSYLLQAQLSKAKVIGLANAASDTTNAIKQASEFGITGGGQSLAGLLVFLTDVHALGLKAAQGLVLTEAFYWDQNDSTRDFSLRFGQRHGGAMPTMVHAGVYASMLHYLKAVEATRSKETQTVMAKMKEMPTDDPLFGKGAIRADGRKIHDMYLFEVKSPAESKSEWDLYKQLAVIPAAEAFRPLREGGCPLVK